ncbi:MAG: DNA polymerase III subunit gamma/tau [Candidatus Eremiobacteraeota bacterium]|nr:DNA polymerase III subunit gamma/tau [Candidatus Eremiobacteraeota bacterium]MBV8262884.1 DNA polymerase III subunit gamma/tau [Candidatus Eremiobacteraeota bacterium]MBV8340630.1 DNA polymerase III subunit gamma/tau [Candidatus Eremiobacteraeota bacterium]MBV8460855.1 DNA polymerase III subunit gamma/tau [Candidatus Eremiobacteraeota bacterium]MBV8669292.1 DNA polymerase III subunit gamma/tau [Candidatus Eremiobacteraeota bacterium]
MPEATPSSAGLTLYRKHRPQAFDDLVGQPAVVTGLQAAVKNSRVAHAYLFAGPRGTGKTSAARILAKCLNCQRGGPRPDPCGECDACRSIAEGTAFDVIEIDAASNRGINEIRELRERVKFAPAQFRTKVYIVDEVHMLTAEAFNALLKTLEEPPPNVVFVLATTEAHKVPPTILSRVQRYEFRRMQPADILERLEAVAKDERIPAQREALQRLAFLADGAMRDALVLLEQARGFAGKGAIDDAVLDAAFGAPVYDVVEQMADAVGESDARAVLASVAEAVDRGTDPAWLAKELLRWFRLALLAQVSPQVLALEVPPETAARISAKAATLARSRLLATLRSLSEAIAQRYSAQPRIDLELALLRVVMPADELSLQAISDRLRALEERTAPRDGSPPPVSPAPSAKRPVVTSGPARKSKERSASTDAQAAIAQAEVPAPEAAEMLNVSKLRALWPHVISAVKERSKPCYGHLEHATIVDASAQTVTLGVPSKFNRDLLAEPAMSSVISAAIGEVAGASVGVQCVVVAGAQTQTSVAGVDAGAFALAESVLGADLF